MLALSGSLVGAFAFQAWGQPPGIAPQPSLTETDPQNSEPVAQITGVQLRPTPTGLEILLQTSAGATTLVQSYTSGRQWIAEITNAQLALPEGDRFRQDKPTEQIESVTVIPLEGNRVQVVVTGTASAPTGQVFLRQGQGLVANIQTPTATAPPPPQAEEELEPIELVVTAEREEEEGYYVPEASVGTRTDTPLRDIPASIQVVPQQVIEDQQATRLNEALRNVPGAGLGGVSPRTVQDFVNIRGFDATGNILRNGIRGLNLSSGGFNLATVEQIEVLRGPASVLYGNLEPGGVINLVTKRPLSEPFYEIEAAAGSFDEFRGAIDLSGPLDESGTVLYRLNAAAQTSETFIDFLFDRRYIVAPVLAINFSENTTLSIWGEYSRIENSFDLGVPAVGSVLPNPLGSIPRSRNLTDPNNFIVDEGFRLGFDLQHEFNDNWQLRSAFLTSFFTEDRDFAFTRFLLDDNRTLTRGFSRGNPVFDDDFYNLDTYITGSFLTGDIQHNLTAGVNINWRDSFLGSEVADAEPIDIFNPIYNPPISPFTPGSFIRDFNSRVIGLYMQDQITILDNLKLSLGGRLDFARQEQQDIASDTKADANYQEFSPRLGIVYQPVRPLSLYASYGRSFSLPDPAFSDLTLEPELGSQYEIGVKAELNERLAATLALYTLTRSNLPTADLGDPLQTIQVGEQRSRGLEFDISGEILPGWSLIAGYALTDAKITEDNTFEVGNRLNNIPKHSFNLWTTYELQSGELQGLGFGVGLFYVGARQGDLVNSFELPSYLRTDAAIFYRQGQLRAALNFRNLFDVDYFAAAQNRNRVFRGDPFTVLGTISWEF